MSGIYNIPAGHSFADALARGVLEMAGDPLKLSTYTILLPSRRACRTLREAFLRLSGDAAILLPNLRPVGEADADEIALFAGVEELPPAVPKLERQLLLAHCIQKAGRAQSFDQAVALSRDLGAFLDEVQTEQLNFDGLAKLVPEEFAGHWQETLEFLKILTEVWPHVLNERGVLDVAARRNLLLEEQLKLWRDNPPQGVVIAAGSTGTVQAASAVLAAVSKLPNGMLVLPGLDAEMDEESWEKLSDDHPQYNMKKLLGLAGVARADVKAWAFSGAHRNAARAHLLSEALRPAETTEKWRGVKIEPEALDHFMRIECETAREEADVIALLMRETLEEPGKTCALITPDRRLARRVSVSLKRWGIEVDDSGGQPLTELPSGSWLMLAAEMAEAGLAPVSLLSFLKHPFMAAQLPPQELRAMVETLDAHLRGPRPAPGLKGLRDVAADDKVLPPLLDVLEQRLAPFAALMEGEEEIPFAKILTAHIRAAESLAEMKDGTSSILWRDAAGEAAAQFLSELLEAAKDVPPVTPESYVALFGGLLKSLTVRARHGLHPRLYILGQIEARLYCADKVILGGLNEGTWPALPAHDPWMSRPMRKKFGLPAPEKSVGLAAHDFVQAASSRDVVLTRAKKSDGAPTVPARWLLRLEAVLQAAGLDWPKDEKYKRWVKALDEAPLLPPLQRPAPKPPVSARPRRLSVTQIETWMRDPYQVYARHVLELRKLDGIDEDPDGGERGEFIHTALERFVEAYSDKIPDDAEERLKQFGREILKEMKLPPDVEAFWWPRFERIATHFVAQERVWRQLATPADVEVQGSMPFEPAFVLRGTADRIDKMKDGSYAVIDYKSGTAPSVSDVKAGLSPQLPLEALMLKRGAFPDLPAGDVAHLAYWRVTGAGASPVEVKAISDVEERVAEAEAGLRALIEKFDDPTTPYYCQPRAEDAPRYNDYAHLARIREWSLGGDDDE